MKNKDYEFALEVLTQLADEKGISLSEKQQDDIIFDAMCNGPAGPATVDAIMEAFDRYYSTLKTEKRNNAGRKAIKESRATAVYDIYNALSDVAFKFHQSGIELEQQDFEIGFKNFMNKFFEG